MGFLIFIKPTWMTFTFLVEWFAGSHYGSIHTAHTAQAAPCNKGPLTVSLGGNENVIMLPWSGSEEFSCKNCAWEPLIKLRSLAQIQSLWPSQQPRFTLLFFYMKETLTMGFTPKSIKLSPASEKKCQSDKQHVYALIIPTRPWL